MSYRRIYYLVGQCLSLDENPQSSESVQHHFSHVEFSTELFISFCTRHHVLYAVYQKLKKHDLLDVFTSSQKQHLAALYLRNTMRNNDILKQMEAISIVIAEENIKPIYLKGTAHLLDGVYNYLGDRLIGDIDFLVEEKDYFKTANLLKHLGYYTLNNVFYGKSISTHYPPMYLDDAPVHVEIHRTPVDHPHNQFYNTSKVFHHKRSIQGKKNTFVPSHEHQIIHNFIHSQLNNLGYSFRVAQLRDLYDFYLLTKGINMQKIIDQSSEKDKLSCYFALTNRVFNTNLDIPNDTNNKAAHYVQSFDWYLEHPKVHHLHILRVKISELIFKRFLSSLRQAKKLQSWKNALRFSIDPEFYKMVLYRIRNFIRNYISPK